MDKESEIINARSNWVRCESQGEFYCEVCYRGGYLPSREIKNNATWELAARQRVILYDLGVFEGDTPRWICDLHYRVKFSDDESLDKLQSIIEFIKGAVKDVHDYQVNTTRRFNDSDARSHHC